MEGLLPEGEQERLAALKRYGILDTDPEDAYDDIVRLAAFICGTPIAAVSLIDSQRQWFKSMLGLGVRETPRSVAFCAHTILQTDLTIVADARTDKRFRANPLVTGDPNIRFYAGAPLITTDGFSLGSLCVIDTVPRTLTADQEAALSTLARQVTSQMELTRQVLLQKQLRAEQMRAEDALRRSEARLSLILRSIQDVVFLLSVEPGEIYRFLFVNPAFLERTGLREEQAIGKRVEEVLPEASHHFLRQRCAEAVQGRLPICWQENVLYQAGQRIGDVVMAPFCDERGVCTHLIGTVHDITEQRRLQEHIARSERLVAMGEMVAGVAHEINNPLAAVSGHAQLLSLHPDPQVQADGRTIQQMTDRVSRIIRSLLTFSRRTNPVDRRASLLRPVIEGTLEIMRHKLRRNDVHVVLDLIEPDLAPVLDTAQIEQILLNLIDNAEHTLRHRHSDKVITIRTARQFEDNQDWATVSVSDNGQGIPEEVRGRVFDPFFTTKPQGEGTGLGLSICFGIAQEHKGRLEVTSEVGVGTTFTLYLPLPDVSETPPDGDFSPEATKTRQESDCPPEGLLSRDSLYRLSNPDTPT